MRARRTFDTRWVVLFSLAAVLACDGRPKTASSASTNRPHSGPALAVLDLTGGAPERETTSLLSLAPKKGSFDELVATLGAIGADANTKGVFVRFGGAQIGIARATEIGESLEKIKKANKPVYCHADGLTNTTLFAAARACSKIYVSPAGEVESIGIAAQILYMHKLLAEQLHMSVDILQVGKFKGAEEPLTRDGPSDEARQSLEGVLADMRASWLDGIRSGRTKDGTGDAAEDGPYSPGRAKDLGLIDEVGYADDARDAARTASGAVRDQTRFGQGAEDEKSDDLGELVRALAGEGGAAPIALVRASGSISMGGGGGLLGGSGGITERAMDKTLARLEKNDDVRAVILRIDSPGGSALASDLIWHRLMKIRAKKPLVISIGDMAASGGYYLASTGNVIFAEGTSIVGSIGVVGGKIAFGHTLETIGVHTETFAANAGKPAAANRAAYLSPLIEWDDPTRARVLETMTGIYDLFLARVAEGRKTTVDKIAPHAEGRIFSGREGKARGLVDEIGGLAAAIAKARELAKLPADAEVAVAGANRGVLESLGSGSSGDDESESVVAAPGDVRLSDVVERVVPDLVPFVTSLAPLATGERSLAIVPYAIVVR